MGVEVKGTVGEANLSPGASGIITLGRNGDIIASLLHGRWYEQNYRGRVFSGGMALTDISNATFTTGTLGATETPIAGVWNPANSPVNLVILRATLGVTITALQATGGGPYVWATSTGNGAISTGNAPMNRRTLLKAGSYAKDMCGVALTGLTNNLIVCCASALGGGSASKAAFLATQVAMQTIQIASVEDLEGALIVPPGGVLALLATTTPVAHSAVSALIWEEVPV